MKYTSKMMLMTAFYSLVFVAAAAILGQAVDRK
jgi:hypothetical protein